VDNSACVQGYLFAVSRGTAELTVSSLLDLQDNLEWGSGFTMHFGLIWIDRTTSALTRVIKNSLRYYSQVLRAFVKTAVKV
jgi:beta-glucosidase/6-phospho-beta-glucosidase/beta-galactosidase